MATLECFGSYSECFGAYGQGVGFEVASLKGVPASAADFLQGFFYNQYPAPNITAFDKRGTDTEVNKNQELWYHVVGTSQDQDIFVLAIPEEPTYSIAAGFTNQKECALKTLLSSCCIHHLLIHFESPAHVVCMVHPVYTEQCACSQSSAYAQVLTDAEALRHCPIIAWALRLMSIA